MIVFIHCKFPGILGSVIVAFARPAVFYFFLVSGFFVYSVDDGKFVNKVKRQSAKVIRLTAICFVISFFWRLLYALIGDAWSIQGVIQDIFNIDKIIRMIVFQSDIVLGPFWFLLALIMCYLAVYLLRRSGLISIYPVLIVITLLLNIYLSEFCSDIESYYYRNFWLTGFPFYMMGYYFHQHWDRIEKTFSDKALMIGIVTGAILTVVEYLLVGSSLIYVGSVILAASLFAFAIKKTTKTIVPLEYIGEKLSMYVYCCHWFVIEAQGTVFTKMGLIGMSGFGYIYPLLSVICSLVLSYIIFMIADRGSLLRKNV